MYVCVYVCMHACMYACMHVCMYASMYVYCACVCVCTWVGVSCTCECAQVGHAATTVCFAPYARRAPHTRRHGHTREATSDTLVLALLRLAKLALPRLAHLQHHAMKPVAKLRRLQCDVSCSRAAACFAPSCTHKLVHLALESRSSDLGICVLTLKCREEKGSFKANAGLKNLRVHVLPSITPSSTCCECSHHSLSFVIDKSIKTSSSSSPAPAS